MLSMSIKTEETEEREERGGIECNQMYETK
jgi:hypothetical protein